MFAPRIQIAKTGFALGWDDGYTNQPPRSKAPEYMEGYRSGEDERYHEERFWGKEMGR